VLQLFKLLLELNKFSVETATSAAEAKQVLTQEKFEMVITDLRMESPSAGFEVVRAADSLTPRPAIAIVTAFPVPSAEWRAAGADALFVKGSNTMDLPTRLQELLAESKRHGVGR
jgi:CheY-like chemotaxis protein